MEIILAPPGPVAPPRPVVAPTGQPPVNSVNSTVQSNNLSTTTASNSNSTNRIMSGMSPAGNIPSGASDQEKVSL